MKTKNGRWTAEEEALLVQAKKEKISTARLSIRLKRSEAGIKRRMRELGLTGNTSGPIRAPQSAIQCNIDPVDQAALWLAAAKSGNLSAMMEIYDAQATLECACTGPAVYAGSLAIQDYWTSKLHSTHPLKFTPESIRMEGDHVAIDYLSFEGKPVWMHLAFDPSGKIIRSECGPRNSSCNNGHRRAA